MTSLQEIENHLNIEIGDKKLRNGRKKDNNNKYYRFDDYYIVALTQGKYMIVDNDRKNRKLLKKHCWCYINDGYAQTNVDKSTKKYHQLLLNYEQGLVADHINRRRFDNRTDNLRVVTYQENMRNITKRTDNTSGITGVSRKQKRKGSFYWDAQIYDNNGMQISKSFNIKKLGDEEAKRLAIEQRRSWEQEFGYLGE